MKLTKQLRDKLGYTLVSGHARPKLAPPAAGLVWMAFFGDPPRTTHHDKRIVMRGGRPGLANSPALQAAHQYYARQIPPRNILVPIQPPITAIVTFMFRVPGATEWTPWTDKPDRDNAAKVLFDELAIAGWIGDDKQVAFGPISKWGVPPGFEGVNVVLYTGMPRHDLTASYEMTDAWTIQPYVAASPTHKGDDAAQGPNDGPARKTRQNRSGGQGKGVRA